MELTTAVMTQMAAGTLLEFFKGAVTTAGQDLYNYIKKWFQGKPQAHQALEQAKLTPEAFLPAVQFYIAELANENAEFQNGLMALVKDLQPDSSVSSVIISRSKNVGFASGQSTVSINVKEGNSNDEKD